MQHKTHFLLALIALPFFSALTTGCSKSSSSPGNFALSATVDNNSYGAGTNATTNFYSVAGRYWNINSYQVVSKDSLTCGLLLSAPFTLNQPVAVHNSWITYSNAAGELFYNPEGTGNVVITVTSWDSLGHKIAGTFSGNLYDTNASGDSVIVTNGQFNTSYVSQ